MLFRFLSWALARIILRMRTALNSLINALLWEVKGFLEPLFSYAG